MGFQNRHFTTDATSFLNWITNFNYVAGNLVMKDGYLIKCLTSHLSGTYSSDVVSGYWEMASPMKNYLINSNFDIW